MLLSTHDAHIRNSLITFHNSLIYLFRFYKFFTALNFINVQIYCKTEGGNLMDFQLYCILLTEI